MNAENEKIEPKTDLELGLNYYNQCNRENLKNDSGAGAGANAASRVDMRFVATGSLSELVWSPDKGLSLQRADSSFTDKNGSHFWDVGPSTLVLAPPESIIGVRSTTDIPIDDVLVKPAAAECVKSDISGKDTPARYPTKNSGAMPDCKAYEEHDTEPSDNMEEMNTAEKVSYVQNEQKNLVTGRGKNICNQVNTGTAENSERKRYKFCTNSDESKPSLEQNPLLTGYMNEGRYNCIGNMAFEKDDVLCCKIGPIIECKDAGALGTNLTLSSRSPVEKLESTSENDLRAFNSEPACGARSRVLVPKSNKIENKSQDKETMLYCDKNLSVVPSPSNSRSRVLRNKGKEKALSDGDANVNLSKDKDDSHESVESCNSAGLFLTGKKRWNFQQLIVGSKRVKKQIEESSGSKSLIKQDSSFMNWISNILKGFSKSIQDEANTLALTLARPDHFHQWPNQKLVTDGKNKDPEPKSTGFQSIFQSIYCLSLKNIGTRVLTGNHQAGEGSTDFEPDNKAHGIDAAPITYCADMDVPYKQYVQSNELEGSTGGYDAGESSQPKIEPINIVNSHESSKSDSVENKNCSNLALGEEKEGMTSNSSSGRQNTNNTENIESYAPSERKEADNDLKGSDILASMWITRFSPKSTTPLIISDHVNHSVDTQVHSINCSKLPQPHKQIAYLNKSKIKDSREQFADDRLLFEANELQNCSINKEASIGPKNDRGIDYHKSMYRFNPTSPSTKFRNSEPMASMFARRLDAIKHIIPSNKTDNSAQPNMNCLFCGKSGHQLHDCSEIASNELEDLLKNINPFQGFEGVACLCIKCFQSNHWAVSCPSSIPRGQHELKRNAFANKCSPVGIQFSESNVENTRPLTDEEDQLSPGGAIINEVDRKTDRNLDLKGKSNEIITSEKIGSNVSIKKHLGSSLEESKLKENSMTSTSSFVERQNSDVPKRISDAVKKLRLSRTDVLKWINSDMSISHLDGLFLRLRLGKWEEGLGGTGYYVASINEAQKQSSGQSSGKSLSVNVGGITCMVGSQYISNHDFLEEEIMAWWCTTTKAGDNVPSEEDLIEKIKKKKMLGL